MAIVSKARPKRQDLLSTETAATAAQLRLAKGFIALSITPARIVGPASQSLGGLFSIIKKDGGRTFRSHRELARWCGVSVRTFAQHLAELVRLGFIIRHGRQKRRTVTYRLGPGFELGDYAPLPRYALGLPWAERLVYAWTVRRANVSKGQATCKDSIAETARQTGLSRPSVYSALEALARRGWIERLPDAVRLLPPPGIKLPPPAETVKILQSNPAPKCKNPAVAEREEKKNTWSKNSNSYPTRKTTAPRSRWTPRDMDQIKISVEEIKDTAARIFAGLRYRGNQGGNVSKIAALFVLGIISENELTDAVEGARICATVSSPGHLFTSLKEKLAKRRLNLRAELARIRIMPFWPKSADELPRVEKPKRVALKHISGQQTWFGCSRAIRTQSPSETRLGQVAIDQAAQGRYETTDDTKHQAAQHKQRVNARSGPGRRYVHHAARSGGTPPATTGPANQTTEDHRPEPTGPPPPPRYQDDGRPTVKAIVRYAKENGKGREWILACCKHYDIDYQG